MPYISTRNISGLTPPVSFDQILFSGTAPDGGLYVPDVLPRLDMHDLAGRSYADVAARVLAPFMVGAGLSADDLNRIAHAVYGSEGSIFRGGGVAPLKQIDDNFYLMELFHGPTLAFKDVALQLLGRLFDHALRDANRTVTILGATSGDTGSAAIHACAGMNGARVFMLHPKGRVSDIQRRQMTTHDGAHIYNIALDGTFDDAQALVKSCFNDHDFARNMHLTAVNSINWARIAAQCVYYLTATLALGRPCSFTVPTGNFGNVFAAYTARKMGAPIKDLVIASNRNDILYRFFETGAMNVDTVIPSTSPSMDIQVSSNFERFLYDLVGRDGARVAALMDQFKTTGRFDVTSAEFTSARAQFAAYRADDTQTIQTIRDVFEKSGVTIDPHTAVGVHAARAHVAKTGDHQTPMIALACAHPAKFNAAVEAATGKPAELPGFMGDIMQKPEKYVEMPNDLGALQHYISSVQ